MSAHDPHPDRSRSGPSARRCASRSRRAFTLVEAAVSIALTTILLSVVGVAITQSISAAERGVDLNQRSRQAAEVFDQVSAELGVATSITTRTSNALEFTVPDMTSAGADPVIRYEWSGRPGDPLMRTYNAKAATPVLNDVRSFSFLSLVRPAPVATESAESVLHSCDQPSGTSTQVYIVRSSDWAAQYVRPTLPSNATSWSISRVSVRVQSNKAGAFSLQVRSASSARQPTSTVLATYSADASTFPSTLTWTDLPVTVTGLSPNQGVCLVLTTKSAARFNLEYVTGSSPSMPINAAWMTSADGGSTWSAALDSADMRFKLCGTVTTTVEQPPQ